MDAFRTPCRTPGRGHGPRIALAAAAVVCAVVLAGLPAAPAWADQAVSEPAGQASLPDTQAPTGDTDAAVLPAPNPYERTKRTFPKTDGTRQDLGTRGYFPDYQCLVTADPCRSRAGNFRPEATAQARVIQALGTKTHIPVVPTAAEADRVQWEVSPLPHAVYAPDHDNPTDWENTAATPGGWTSPWTTAGPPPASSRSNAGRPPCTPTSMRNWSATSTKPGPPASTS